MRIAERSAVKAGRTGSGGVPTLCDAGGPEGAARAELGALDPARLGLWIFLATVTMLFAAFSSAYLVRMASGAWTAVPLPGVLWASTAVLMVSSVTIETARQRADRSVGRSLRWVALTLALGFAFLALQAGAWRALEAAGVLLPTSPHAAFLYVFTALHAAHLLGGLIWLAALLRSDAGPDRLARCATYWHFMGGLWIYLFLVLHLG